MLLSALPVPLFDYSDSFKTDSNVHLSFSFPARVRLLFSAKNQALELLTQGLDSWQYLRKFCMTLIEGSYCPILVTKIC